MKGGAARYPAFDVAAGHPIDVKQRINLCRTTRQHAPGFAFESRQLLAITALPTGYPIYRLEWQAVGSLQRRLRGCMSGVRSEPYDYGAQELVNLELYLMWRARGMAVESPAVRP